MFRNSKVTFVDTVKLWQDENIFDKPDGGVVAHPMLPASVNPGVIDLTGEDELTKRITSPPRPVSVPVTSPQRGFIAESDSESDYESDYEI